MTTGFFSIKNDHEFEYYDEEIGEIVPCEVCEGDHNWKFWSGAFWSQDDYYGSHDPRDITIVF